MEQISESDEKYVRLEETLRGYSNRISQFERDQGKSIQEKLEL